MAGYRLSAKAVEDIDGLYEYTILSFGLMQAREYLTGMHQRFEILAAQPNVGRAVPNLAVGLRCLDYQSHVVFYVPTDDGVWIVRVLHRSMDAKRHL